MSSGVATSIISKLSAGNDHQGTPSYEGTFFISREHQLLHQPPTINDYDVDGATCLLIDVHVNVENQEAFLTKHFLGHENKAFVDTVLAVLREYVGSVVDALNAEGNCDLIEVELEVLHA